MNLINKKKSKKKKIKKYIECWLLDNTKNWPWK